jgi:hypothetical protein
MIVETTAIPDVKLLTPRRFPDGRGSSLRPGTWAGLSRPAFPACSFRTTTRCRSTAG